MRKARILRQGAVYHVMARTNRGEFLLNSDEMKKMFIGILEEAKKKFLFKIKHFCIMNNHIHLLIEPLKGTILSKLMQWIPSVFAIRFNKMFGLTGHVWYKSKIIHDFKQLINTFQYISDNTVKAGICPDGRKYFFQDCI
jgi:REP element-mobilizing transposase RayT